ARPHLQDRIAPMGERQRGGGRRRLLRGRPQRLRQRLPGEIGSRQVGGEIRRDDVDLVAGPEPIADDLARRLRGFGPVGLLAVVAILAGNVLVIPLSAVLVLVWAHLSDTPWGAF